MISKFKITHLGILVALIGLGYLLYSFSALHTYWVLDKKVPLTHLTLTPVQVSDEKWKIEADYTYLNYENKEDIKVSYLHNEWAAKNYIQELKNVTEVWIDSKNPAHSSLQKTFPTKQLVYTLILFGIALYFYFFEAWIPPSVKNKR